MDALFNWVLRLLLLLAGAGAAVWLVRWTVAAWRDEQERWPVRLAAGMLALSLLYGVGHARLLLNAEEIEEGRDAYVRYGDPRRAEQRRAEVRGWILDCSGRADEAFALYGERDGRVDRIYPIGEAGANLIGGGEQTGIRDFTVERLFAAELRRPRSLIELGELHPAGSDLSLTLCSGATAEAWSLLRETEREGAVVVQDVRTGALVAYASTGDADQPPIGLQEYSAPGSVWKLTLAALWWESGLPDTVLGCPGSIQITPRARINNFGGRGRGEVTAPTEMLVYSCNTTAVEMGLMMRERLGERAFLRALESYGFRTYFEDAPDGFDEDFWVTSSSSWRRRMSPAVGRVKIDERTSRQEWGQLSIGQGPIDVTPIHLSRFLQAIGNGGVMMRPVLEADLARDPEELRRVMSAETASKLQAAMKGVVERGTAVSVRPIVDAIDWDLAGKTGTAQVRGRADNGWFGGLIYGPDGAARYSVVVFLRGGGPGGGQPARVAAMLARYFATDPAGEVVE